jgi:hypothetical protein
VITGGVALYLEEQQIYRVENANGAREAAIHDLRDRACPACRDPVEGPERWQCCVVFFNDGELALHFFELDPA